MPRYKPLDSSFLSQPDISTPPAPRPFLVDKRVKPKPKRPVSSTTSPLADPQGPTHQLAAELQSCLYLPDPSPLYAVCGTVVANMIEGYPVWMMLIGPPESGKTELLKHLIGLDRIFECGDLSGKAALLSGTRAKDVAADATGGVLKMLETEAKGGPVRGCLIMLDFARTVLAADPKTARETLGAIGMIHDQHYQRDIGADGGRTITFNGKVGFIAACTDVIDHPDHQQANNEMGDRCIYYRYPVSNGYHEISSALDNPDSTYKNSKIKSLFAAWFEAIWLGWEENVDKPKPPEEPEKRMLIALSQFAARGRSGVLRSRYKEEIIGVSRSALGPRLAITFAQLLRGLERCLCSPEECRAVLRSCARDSIPAVRLAALDAIQEGARGISDIADRVRIDLNATRRVLEDLRAHDLTVCDRPDGLGKWRLSALTEELLRDGWADE